MCKRVGKCEGILMEKEKDIAFLKYNLQELKTNSQGKQEEVDSLKAKNENIGIKMENFVLKNELLEKKIDSFEKQMLVSKKSLEDKTLFNDNINVEIGTLKVTNINIENEMKLMKDQNEELRIHVERENNDLKNKNQLLETKLDSLGNQLVVEKQLLCNNQSEIINVKTQVGEMKKNLIENMKSCQKQSENVEVQLSKLLKFDNSSFASEVNKLKDKVNKANNEIRATRSHVDKTLNGKTNEINKLYARVTTTEKTINILNTLDDEVKRLSEHINLMKDNQKDINNAMEKVDNLKGHVMTNIENILFCDSSYGRMDILIQWKLQNYQYHFDIGIDVFSPIFFTQVNGYCYQFMVKWFGKEKENLGLCVQFHSGSNCVKMPYSLEMVDNNGNILSKKISLSQIEIFTSPHGKHECGRGYPKFLSMPDLNNYILNDMLSIQCRLRTS